MLKKHGGELATSDDAAFTLEDFAQRTGRMIIFEFPSEAQARAWNTDPDYQASAALPGSLKAASPDITPSVLKHTLSWHVSMPRARRRSSTWWSDSGHRTYLSTPSWMISGEAFISERGSCSFFEGNRPARRPQVPSSADNTPTRRNTVTSIMALPENWQANRLMRPLPHLILPMLMTFK